MIKLKRRKCKHCKEIFEQQRPLQYLCGVHCGAKYAHALAQKKDKKKMGEMKKSLLTLSDYEKIARKIFQRWVRLRDKNLPCISCGVVTTPQWDGGHYLKAELFSGLIFNEMNCHKQCSRCNDLYSGNELEYRDGLIKRYGLDYVNELESIKNQNRNYKYTREQLTEITETYKQKIKQL